MKISSSADFPTNKNNHSHVD